MHVAGSYIWGNGFDHREKTFSIPAVKYIPSATPMDAETITVQMHEEM
jgi:hypothetical protein